MTHTQAFDGTGFRRDVDRLGEGVETLKADVRDVAHGAADAARSGVAELRHGAHRAVETVRATLGDARGAAVRKYAGASKAAGRAADSLKATVGRNPVASVGIATGVGVLIGLAIARSWKQT